MKIAMIFGLIALTSFGSISATHETHAQSFGSSSHRVDDGVSVVFLKNNRKKDREQQVPYRFLRPSPETIALAQSEIRSNPNLRAILTSKRVQLRNVVGVQTALNGGKIVYVR